MAPEFLVTAPVGVTTLGYACFGIALGTCSGLTPGLHANNFALVLAAFVPALPGPTVALGAAMLAAGVVHTFLDIVPALALGVPDPATAAVTLPGHRLVLDGRGLEALRLSALGSGLAVVAALVVAVPLTQAVEVAYPTLRRHMPAVLVVVGLVLVFTESTWPRRVAAVCVLGVAAGLGWVVLDLSLSGPIAAGGVLAPLFAGLFGAPVLIEALDGEGIPPQADPTVTLDRRTLAGTAGAGAGAGALVGYLPGVSAAVGTVLVLPAVPGEADARGFLVASSGANTANTIFALFALLALGTPRTGVMVAMDRAGVPGATGVLVATACLASAVGFALVVSVGDAYLRTVGRLDHTRVSLVTGGLLVVLAYLFAGGMGLAVFALAAVVGLLPPVLGVRRVHLMAVLAPAIVAG
ncbi:putative membrane protein [Haloplanus vescus]|uniref:Putative membrane protein n=1 Tax=Haloplanus vescus TaxID=555874 RepID=A0A1H3VYE2_9EURY|nr:tripartite tricarboxylate transporter permease [Haloplanus vescus]SDZ79711.1 putative membrane protein [Haloplanus vescus]